MKNAKSNLQETENQFFIVAKLYEAENEKNYFQEKELLQVVNKPATEEEFHQFRNEYLSNPLFNKSLSFCWFLPEEEAKKIN